MFRPTLGADNKQKNSTKKQNLDANDFYWGRACRMMHFMLWQLHKYVHWNVAMKENECIFYTLSWRVFFQWLELRRSKILVMMIWPRILNFAPCKQFYNINNRSLVFFQTAQVTFWPSWPCPLTFWKNKGFCTMLMVNNTDIPIVIMIEWDVLLHPSHLCKNTFYLKNWQKSR